VTVRSLSPASAVLAGIACLWMLWLAAAHVGGQAPAPSLQVLSRDGRRAIPITTSGSQELIPLDDLAAAFQLNVRDDGGAITVGYRGRTIVLTPDQTIASVAGRLISLPAAPVRSGNRWLVPIDFISRALAPIYDTKLELRRPSHLLIVGDLRVPRVAARHEVLGASARLTFDIQPSAGTAISQQGTQRLMVRFDADALDLSLPAFQSAGYVQAVRAVDALNVAVDLGPRFASFRSTTQSIDGGTRLTIDLLGAQTEAAPPAGPAPPAPSEAPVIMPSTPGIRTVAIDPGHGGADLGARGPAGTIEKDLTLSVARRLKGAIEARLGLRVVMTREDDREVPVENRTALANNNKADLFISLHANGSFRPEVSGATVFVAAFSEADLANEGQAAERLPVFGGGLRTIEVVPWNLAQMPHRDDSERFAQTVAGALGGRVPVAMRPLEHAPLRVLVSANMPAVLVEMGYLTNAAQETALAGNDLQNALSQALLDAIVRFRDATSASASAAAPAAALPAAPPSAAPPSASPSSSSSPAAANAAPVSAGAAR
jgi:N-acetylmuramoyl-L-alanine amidase